MLTDRPPRRPALLAEFFASDRLGTLELLPDDRLCAVARTIEEGMKTGRAAPRVLTSAGEDSGLVAETATIAPANSRVSLLG
jgi:hypothetical protein